MIFKAKTFLFETDGSAALKFIFMGQKWFFEKRRSKYVEQSKIQSTGPNKFKYGSKCDL